MGERRIFILRCNALQITLQGVRPFFTHFFPSTIAGPRAMSTAGAQARAGGQPCMQCALQMGDMEETEAMDISMTPSATHFATHFATQNRENRESTFTHFFALWHPPDWGNLFQLLSEYFLNGFCSRIRTLNLIKSNIQMSYCSLFELRIYSFLS